MYSFPGSRVQPSASGEQYALFLFRLWQSANPRRSPKVALAKRPSVDEELLVEVLSSHLLCISDDDLCDLLFNWEDPIGDATRNLIEKCVPNISPEKREKLRSSNSAGEPEQKRLKLVRSMHGARSEYTEDLILSIKGRFDKKWGMRNDVTEQEPQAFLSNWVRCSVQSEPKRGRYISLGSSSGFLYAFARRELV